MSIHNRIHSGCCRERKTRFVVLLQHTRQHHTRRGRVRRQVPTHSVSILENDTICRLGSVIRIDTLVLDERHVKRSVNVQTVLLRKEDILRHEIGTKHCRTRRNVQGHQTVLFAVELSVATIGVGGSRKVRWCRWCRWRGGWWRRGGYDRVGKVYLMVLICRGTAHRVPVSTSVVRIGTSHTPIVESIVWID